MLSGLIIVDKLGYHDLESQLGREIPFIEYAILGNKCM